MTASKAAAMIRIMYDKIQGDPRFVAWVAAKIRRGT